MKQLTFSMDYTYCPKGHGDWIFIPASTLFYDVWFCEKCDCFYEPTVTKIKKGAINKNFHSDREKQLFDRAMFLKWKNALSYEDFIKSK